MTSKSVGLIEKYSVERTDGQPVGQVFVLEDDDPLAIPALGAYAAAARAAGYVPLANDLAREIERRIEIQGGHAARRLSLAMDQVKFVLDRYAEDHPCIHGGGCESTEWPAQIRPRLEEVDRQAEALQASNTEAWREVFRLKKFLEEHGIDPGAPR